MAFTKHYKAPALPRFTRHPCGAVQGIGASSTLGRMSPRQHDVRFESNRSAYGRCRISKSIRVAYLPPMAAAGFARRLCAVRFPSGLPKSVGRKFAKKSPVGPCKPPEIPDTQAEGDLGDGGLIRAARPEKLPRLVQAANAKECDGRKPITALEGGSETSFGHAALPSQIRD